MNLIKKSIYIFFLLASSAISAQTVVWQMKPQALSDLRRVSENLYFAVANGKVGLLRSDGSVAASVECDAVIGFYEHKAILTKADGRGERVMGCLFDDGTWHAFGDSFYTLAGQKFFSDGLLSVADAGGRVGYIDAFGNKVLGFDGRFDRIKPFSEGYAAVFKNKRYSLISKSGAAVAFTFNSVAEVNSGTNVYNGNVYVWDTTGKLYVCQPHRGGSCVKTKWPSQRGYDYLHRFAALTGKGKDVPMVGINEFGVKESDVVPFSAGGLVGYRSSQGTVLPCQFDGVSDFRSGQAVVTLHGQKGILRYVGEQNFTLTPPQNPVPYTEGSKAQCSFLLQVPEAWQGKTLDVTLNAGGTPIALSRSGNTCTFSCDPRQLSGDLYVEVRADGLLLCQENIDIKFRKIVLCRVCHKDIEQCHYRGAHPEPKKSICPKCHKELDKCPGHKNKETKVERCKICLKSIKDCEWHGVHPN